MAGFSYNRAPTPCTWAASDSEDSDSDYDEEELKEIKSLAKSCAEAVDNLVAFPKKGILRYREKGDLMLPKKGPKTRKLKFVLSPEQEERADRPFRGENYQELKKRAKISKALKRVEGEKSKSDFEKAGPAMEQHVYKHDVSVKPSDQQVLTPMLKPRFYDPTFPMPFSWDMLKPIPIPDNIDDYVTITEYSPPELEIDEILELGELTEKALNLIWKKLRKAEPVITI